MDDPWGSTRFEHMLAGRRPRGSEVVASRIRRSADAAMDCRHFAR
jgi:hypothetical protein